MTKVSVLMVLTSAEMTKTGKLAGYYLPEAAHPYYTFLKAGFHVDFASPQGPHPPISRKSVEDYGTGDNPSHNFLEDREVLDKLSQCKTLSEVNASDYDAVFYVGGHGPVIDLAYDDTNAKLASEFWNSGKIVSAVCHGPAALVRAKDSNGNSIFKGKEFTGFTNAEEREHGLPIEDIGFWLEDKITKELGGKFFSADVMQPNVVVSSEGKLFTGQNPASAQPLAEAIVRYFNVQ